MDFWAVVMIFEVGENSAFGFFNSGTSTKTSKRPLNTVEQVQSVGRGASLSSTTPLNCNLVVAGFFHC